MAEQAWYQEQRDNRPNHIPSYQTPEELAELALKETDISQKRRFYSLLDDLHFYPSWLLDEVKTLDYLFWQTDQEREFRYEYLLDVLLIMLGKAYQGEAEIREYCDNLEEKGAPLYLFLPLKLYILLHDEPEKLLSYVQAIPVELSDDDIWHSAHIDILCLCETTPIPALLYHIYETNYCASCREDAVTLMEQHGCLTDEIAKAGCYDSEKGIRIICRNYIKKERSI